MESVQTKSSVVGRLHVMVSLSDQHFLVIQTVCVGLSLKMWLYEMR